MIPKPPLPTQQAPLARASGRGAGGEGPPAHHPRRRFSQNFLHDRAVVARIVEAIDPQPGQNIVEIGPGLGALTGQLIERAGRIAAVEIDRDLAARLRERYPPQTLGLIEADALRLDWRRLAQDAGGRLRIVGNLPYHVSTPLLFALLPVAAHVQDQHFMLQREVVERMVAAPGSKDYGRLSVMLQFRYRMERLFNVAPGAFTPAPKVQSSIVRMRPLAEAQAPALPVDEFAKVVAAAFGQRRKTLRNALSGLLSEQAIARCGIDPGVRGEVLGVHEFARLALALSGDQAS